MRFLMKKYLKDNYEYLNTVEFWIFKYGRILNI